MPENKKLRVCIADDNDLNLMVLTEALEDHGYHVEAFPEGDVIWEYLQNHPQEVDLVLLDRMMDTIDGVALTKLIRNHPLLKDKPVIMQSGEVEPDKIQIAMDAGINYYLGKPFEPNDVCQAVAQTAKKCGLL